MTIHALFILTVLLLLLEGCTIHQFSQVNSSKLMLMFSAQWADYISESPERAAEVQGWAANGHEITWHYGFDHGNWDRYSNYSEQYVASCDEIETAHPGVCPQDCGNATQSRTQNLKLRTGNGKCGDGVCDSFEQAKSIIYLGEC